jgi:hypothetical protein
MVPLGEPVRGCCSVIGGPPLSGARWTWAKAGVVDTKQKLAPASTSVNSEFRRIVCSSILAELFVSPRLILAARQD